MRNYSEARREAYLIMIAAISILGILITSVAALATHVILTIQNEQWYLLIAGAIMPPVGIIHGIGIWLGIF